MKRIDKFLETGLKANFVQKAIFGEQIKTILRSQISEDKKEVLKDLLEMAREDESDKIRLAVEYYSKKYYIKL